MGIPENVISVRVFGSIARSDDDDMSDADVLVVVRDRSGMAAESAIRDYVSKYLNRTLAISWYGQERLQSMFSDGHLFSWHLFLESVALYGPDSIEQLFGHPAPYRDALIDISSFDEVLRSIPRAIRKCPGNAVYEMGLAYVCIRNIGMSASWHLCARPDFTRYSPFHLDAQPFSGPKRQYELAMSCRMASQRGSRPLGSVTPDDVLSLQEVASEWSDAVKKGIYSNA